jgi:hypothetical protein
MLEIALPNAYRVDIIESEAGWGSKIDEIKYFQTEAAAKQFVTEYNTKYNPPGPTPAWYMIAQYFGRVR